MDKGIQRIFYFGVRKKKLKSVHISTPLEGHKRFIVKKYIGINFQENFELKLQLSFHVHEL